MIGKIKKKGWLVMRRISMAWPVVLRRCSHDSKDAVKLFYLCLIWKQWSSHYQFRKYAPYSHKQRGRHENKRKIRHSRIDISRGLHGDGDDEIGNYRLHRRRR